MNDVSSIIFKILLGLLASFITYYIIPYIKSKTYTVSNERLLQIVESAVKSYEQTIGRGNGKLKKAEVIKFVHEWLIQNGITITDKELDILIESMVFKMNKETSHGTTVIKS